MRIRLLSTIAFALALTASAQNAPTISPAGQVSGAGGGQGPRGGRGGFGMGQGRGILGTVTEVTAEHYTVKTDAGLTYTVHFSVNTRIMKQQAGQHERGQRGQAGQDSSAAATNPPQAIKPTDIKVGDAIAASGEVDATAKSVGAVFILQIDPERAKLMREMQANYGKTWLAGKVTAMDGVKVTLLGINDNAAHSFIADENTTFRKRRDPITLADIQVGDSVRVEGAIKDGTFLATSVVAMSPQPAESPSVPRASQPTPQQR
jgi:hypothetical protein